jgi:hypothetical protein
MSNEGGGDIVQVEPGALESLQRGEMDMSIRSAHLHPRNIQRCLQECQALIRADKETAKSCWYTLPRKDADGRTKHIEGPSIRLGEIVSLAWGNIRLASRLITVGDTMLTVQGVVQDLERNLTASVEVQRRITGKTGRRYSDDMIVVTANAAASIAIRNAIFRIVPRAYVNQLMQVAKAVVLGADQPLAERQAKALAWFSGQGISGERVYAYLNRPIGCQLTQDDLETLMGLATAIQDGDLDPAETFPDPAEQAKEEQQGMAGLRARMAKPKPSEAPVPAEAVEESGPVGGEQPGQAEPPAPVAQNAPPAGPTPADADDFEALAVIIHERLDALGAEKQKKILTLYGIRATDSKSLAKLRSASANTFRSFCRELGLTV